MSVIYVLLAISLVVAIVFFTIFIISVRSGQYDDSYTPSVRMLFEDEIVKDTSSAKSTKTEKKNKSIQLKQSQKL
ncbi:cbb3-type cytochrome oxidase assembly protein CcoS [Maribacter sp. TH_r10]|uniref:Cbb3-type cytochrome oxidase assembly protein CcoS n=1 Tax=Maribacter luteus TaxID=2594478 RepID=A0A6I2MLU8_9FLAO|nr:MULTISPECIES: cbb3-type cytochrome oxidase assembly protein CcoS [Maribacter]MDV7139865.1 cbb3-type cytochrome oxidase assembly protein CcoS [Maribacter sp. TH_r10]MRX63480.1 cbb3-type cytochrome oxidase assembly protein CcoS [Maribacter luteus]|tara:strand:+ start:5421 stop:5645 length:225 start_codon:yes stop_codon:yes gene_type:complete